MRPFFEKVAVRPGSSWTLLNRRLDDGIPFEWHHHPEFELTLTLNSRGQRYIGDDISPYGDGDLVLLGPNLPHTWCSAERLSPAEPHVALVCWFTESWGTQITATLAEMQSVAPMLARAGRGIVFSRDAVGAARPVIESIPPLAPADRLFRLMEVLALLATDEGWRFIAGAGADRRKVASPDQSRIERVLDHIHAHYREPVSINALADVAALSPSGFHRLFRRHTKLTVSDYVSELRIGQACAMLINTDRPIAHIADEVGYPSLANFNRQFRGRKDMTPRQFRQRFGSQTRS
jgi:AraC-like DNA-binding protein